MADIAQGSDITPPAVTEADAQALSQVPADASADQTALDNHVNDIAAGVLGLSINDPRLKGGTSDSTTTGTDGADATVDGAAEPPADTGVVEPPTTTQTPEVVAPAASDKGAEPPSPVETPPVVPVARDYSLTVVDAEGKEYKIEKIEDLPEDFNPKNNRQVIEILNDLNKAEQQRVSDAAADEVTAQTAAQEAARTQQLSAWDKEIENLQTAGLLDKPKLAQTDPKYLEDPAMKRISDVFSYMTKVNTERQAAGNQNYLRSFPDALEKMELAEMRTKQAQAVKDEADTAKLKAGVVGGGSAKGGVTAPPVYVAGSAQDIRDLL